MIRGRWTQSAQGTAITVSGIVGGLLVWEGLVRLLDVPPYLLPAPSAIVLSMWRFRQVLLVDAWYTTYETVLGFALGAAIGFALAVLVIFSRVLERIVMPAAVLTQIVPKLAVAPLFVVWFGTGVAPKLAITALMVIFPVLLNCVAGLLTVDRRWLELFDSVCASRWQLFRKIQLPNSSPYIFAGLKLGMTLAVVGAIVGEWMGADHGLGAEMLIANSQLHTDLVFASLLVLSAIGLALFGVIALVEDVTLPKYRRVNIVG
jgi:NitT/TauT family transport system permease protein